jgi:SAM-dependent methyltransferase
MGKIAVTRPYRWLAQHYDQFFEAYRPLLDAARQHILGPLLPRLESGCDIACGTGTTAVELAAKGLVMSALDLSPEMCRLTREKARCANLPLRVQRADMRTFRLPQAVDLILCEGDAVNHVPRRPDLARVARAAARALRPGGYFYFDVNNRLAFERHWQSTFWTEKPGVVMVMRNDFDPKRDVAWTDVEWFIRRGKHWERRQEHVEEIFWTPTEIRGTLRAAGFDSVRAWDAAPFFQDSSHAIARGRTFFLARKRLS